MRKSSIKLQSKDIQTAIDTAIREGRTTLDGIVFMVQQMGGEASRSSIGRYRKNVTQKFEDFQFAQETAKVWATKFNEEPDGDVGTLVGQMLRAVSMQAVAAMNDEKDEKGDAKPVKPMDIMLIAKALDHLAKTDSTQMALRQKIKAEVLLDAAKSLRASGERNGVSKDTIAQIERDVLGMKP